MPDTRHRTERYHELPLEIKDKTLQDPPGMQARGDAGSERDEEAGRVEVESGSIQFSGKEAVVILGLLLDRLWSEP